MTKRRGGKQRGHREKWQRGRGRQRRERQRRERQRRGRLGLIVWFNEVNLNTTYVLNTSIYDT
jgi:hypothetical protein